MTSFFIVENASLATTHSNVCTAYMMYSGAQKIRLFFIKFFQKILVKIELYFSKKRSSNTGFNIIFCALFNDVLLDK